MDVEEENPRPDLALALSALAQSPVSSEPPVPQALKGQRYQLAVYELLQSYSPLVQILSANNNELIDSLGVRTITANRLNEWPNMLAPQ